MKNILTCIVVFCLVLLCCNSCKKNWLNAKPDQSLIVPKTLTDLELLMNNTGTLNSAAPKMGEMSADNFYLTTPVFLGRTESDRNIYSWASENLYPGNAIVSDWEWPYKVVNCANIVLEAVGRIERNEQNANFWDEIKGRACFHRAHAYYLLAQVFCKAFYKESANDDPGLIIRVESDINKPSKRFSVRQTYDRIIDDLQQAQKLLKNQSAPYPTTPFRATALALLARTYLSMEEYDSAFVYADAALQIKNTLVNYSLTYSPANTNPITPSSPEILFDYTMGSSTIFPHNNGLGIVDTFLFSQYDANDMRQTIFFKNISGRRAFCGSYSGLPQLLFSGIATDEIYLIRSECYVRKGDVAMALQDLNTLIKARWKHTVPYPAITATDATDALNKILIERRKELCFRGIRWTDLRRLNREPVFVKTLTRFVNGVNYFLAPNDQRYVFPIPDSEIMFSGVEQNPR